MAPKLLILLYLIVVLYCLCYTINRLLDFNNWGIGGTWCL